MTRDIELIRPRVSNADCVDGFFIAARPCLLIRDGRVPRNYIRGSLLPGYERVETPANCLIQRLPPRRSRLGTFLGEYQEIDRSASTLRRVERQGTKARGEYSPETRSR